MRAARAVRPTLAISAPALFSRAPLSAVGKEAFEAKLAAALGRNAA